MTEDYFWDEMDSVSVNNAIEVSGMPKEVQEKVFKTSGYTGKMEKKNQTGKSVTWSYRNI